MNCDWGNDLCRDDGFLAESGSLRRYICAKHIDVVNEAYRQSFHFVTKEQEHERFQQDMLARRKADPEWDR